MKTTFKHSIKRLIAPVIIGMLFASCASYSTVYIPSGQEFVLGEYEKANYKLDLKNLDRQIINFKAVSKESGDITQSFGLDSLGKTTVYISRNENVILQNSSKEEVAVRVRFSKGVEGMRYRMIKE